MSNKVKSVSKKYAINEFKTVGLVLILYCLFVLFVPLVLDELNILFGEITFFGIDAYRIAHIACIVIGTVIPFMLLRISSKKKLSDFFASSGLTLSNHLVNYVVFFVAIAASVFVTMMLGQFINVSGELVSSIGLTLNEEYMSDIFYVLAFILITPIVEEYAFRGCLLFCLSKYGKYFAYIASSIIYALAHGSFVEMIPAFFMGLILSKMALKYKSIRPTIVIRILFNLTLYGLSLVPERFSLYMIVGLAIVFVLAAVLIITKEYNFITIKKSNSNKQVTLLFFSTFTVCFAAILFILHTVLLLAI